MADEVGIVMKLYDEVSPTLKSITGSSKAFDKTMDDLEESLKAYDKAQTTLTEKMSGLKKELAESNVKVKEAQQAYKKLKDETSKGALDDAIDEQTRLRREMEETRTVIDANATAYKNLYKEVTSAASAESRLSNRAGDGGSALMEGLKSAGITKMLGDSAAQLAGFVLESAVGQPTATAVGGILSGIASGAAMGAMTGTPHGIAIGAALGGLSGVANAITTVGSSQDEAFKSYVQEATEGQMEEMATSITSGSSIAAQRELDAIAFNQLLGSGVGDRYLEDLRALAAATPMEYSDLTAMSRALATGFGGDTDRMLELMTGIGNAGSAVGVDASGMTVMAQALSRMQSSDKASLEYLNMFQERGVDVIGMLAGSLGVTQGEVYDMISKGSISGTQAVSIIQQGLEQYAGAMNEMSQTFSGLESTLSDAQAEMDNAYGEGYNRVRKEGYQAEIDWLTGESGAAMQEAYNAIGAWQAELENSKEQFIRDAQDAVLNSDAYQEAIASGTEEGYVKAGEMLAKAKIQGINEYNASEGAQLMVEYELSLADGIREDTRSNEAYWDAGYRKGQEYSKGLMAGMNYHWDEEAYREALGLPEPAPKVEVDPDAPWYERVQAGLQAYQDRLMAGINGSHAYGLDRVPRNGLYYLHQDERVLTAREAGEQSR
ncbi:tape measure protein, partial [uncultured Pseudoflavonifractor sp.]|uniref:tape measure protein n=1 Tax=uncultured Pseudoflavonifractor sp. TaxID=1221379 RepID=UPI0025CCD118